MKIKTHDCPYLQRKHNCVHKGKTKVCGYYNALDCEFYLEWVENKESTINDENIQLEGSYEA